MRPVISQVACHHASARNLSSRTHNSYASAEVPHEVGGSHGTESMLSVRTYSEHTSCPQGPSGTVGIAGETPLIAHGARELGATYVRVAQRGVRDG
jgi:hypothetical protein